MKWWERILQFLGWKNDYRVVRKLGEGGFGITYLVQNKKTKAQYVMKRFRWRWTYNTPEIQRQFYSLEAMGANTYFVCPVAVTKQGFYKVLIMEYLEGYKTLWQMEEQNVIHSISLSQKKKIANKLLKGISYLHSKEYAHRDIKPENIMVHPTTFDARIIDFGTACNQTTCPQFFQGTVSYMAPEIKKRFFDDTVDKIQLKQYQKADLYSIGLVLLILFGGVDKVLEIWNANRQEKAIVLERLNKEYIQKYLGRNIILLNLDPSKRKIK